MSAAARGPAQPVYILRGHTAQIHALHFCNDNLRLLTGDADGWVVLWNLVSKRAITVWRAHEKSILTLYSWTGDRIITHGRDDALRVWHIPSAAEDTLSKALPAEGYDIHRQPPWLLHSLLVNTMNFCSFAACQSPSQDTSVEKDKGKLVLAVPGTQDGYVHIHELPSEKCIHIVPPASNTAKSLIMSIKLYVAEARLYVVTGNEAGETSVQRLVDNHNAEQGANTWQTLYSARPHSQPILSLDIAPSQSRFFTSSADATIASHLLPTYLTLTIAPPSAKSDSQQGMIMVSTGHAGQQSLVCRDDNLIFATAGWDARVRVYSAKSLKEVAVLKWHKDGCYSVAFASTTTSSSSTTINDSSTVERKQTLERATDTGLRDAVTALETDDRNTTEQQPVMVQRMDTPSLPSSSIGTNMTGQKRREQNTRMKHWLAAGSKDGKVSLWDIF